MDNLEELIITAQHGNTQAFGKIYNLFYKRIYRYCYINCNGNIEESKDLCQETFVKAWKNISGFSMNNGGSFQAYLFRIARNLIIDKSRKKKEVLLDTEIEIESKENLEDNLGRKEQQEIINKALGKLDDLDRQIVILRYFEELSFTEVAHTLKLNEGALRVRTHRALKKLKNILNGDKNG